MFFNFRGSNFSSTEKQILGSFAPAQSIKLFFNIHESDVSSTYFQETSTCVWHLTDFASPQVQTLTSENSLQKVIISALQCTSEGGPRASSSPNNLPTAYPSTRDHDHDHDHAPIVHSAHADNMYGKNGHAAYRAILSRPGSSSSGYDTSPEYDSQSNSAQAVTAYGHSSPVDAHHGSASTATNKTRNPKSGQPSSRGNASEHTGSRGGDDDRHRNGQKYGERDRRNGTNGGGGGKSHAVVHASRRGPHDSHDGRFDLNGVPYATSTELSSSSSPPQHSPSQGSVGAERAERSDRAHVRGTWGEARGRHHDHHNGHVDDRFSHSAGRAHRDDHEGRNSVSNVRMRSDVAEYGSSHLNQNGHHPQQHHTNEDSESSSLSSSSLSSFSSTASLARFPDDSVSPVLQSPHVESSFATRSNHGVGPDLSQGTGLFDAGARCRGPPGRQMELHGTVHTAHSRGHDGYYSASSSSSPVHDKSSASQGWHVRVADSDLQHKHVQSHSSPNSGARINHSQQDAMDYNNRTPDIVKDNRRLRSQNGEPYVGDAKQMNGMVEYDEDYNSRAARSRNSEPPLGHETHNRSQGKSTRRSKKDAVRGAPTDTASSYAGGGGMQHDGRLWNSVGSRGHSDSELNMGGTLDAVKSRREELERYAALRVYMHTYIHT